MGFFFHRKTQCPVSKPTTYQCRFSIKSNAVPAPTGYNQLNEAEQQFFSEFERALVAARLSPYDITLTRLSAGTFNINHSSGYLGKINLRPTKNKSFYMQYLGPRGGVKEINSNRLDECISSIPFWIQSIVRYQNIRKRALKV